MPKAKAIIAGPPCRKDIQFARHPALRSVVYREQRLVCVLSCGHEVVLWDGYQGAAVVLCPCCEATPC